MGDDSKGDSNLGEREGAASFQQRVAPWMMACFGPAIAADVTERNHRFLEEALELVQSCGATQAEVRHLVDYVYGRPAGEMAQEIGGVMVTLAALCLAHGQDMHAAGDTELARIWTKVEQIRDRQLTKPRKAGESRADDNWQPTHRHYKGGLYRVLFEAIHTETEEPMTVYQTPDGRNWVRPAAMFNDTLPDGRRRFTPLGAGAAD
jgi:hypothetical protein